MFAPGGDNTDEFLTRLAWLYFVGGLTQAEVAAQLGITRLRVNRGLAAARARGLARVELELALRRRPRSPGPACHPLRPPRRADRHRRAASLRSLCRDRRGPRRLSRRRPRPGPLAEHRRRLGPDDRDGGPHAAPAQPARSRGGLDGGRHHARSVLQLLRRRRQSRRPARRTPLDPRRADLCRDPRAGRGGPRQRSLCRPSAQGSRGGRGDPRHRRSHREILSDARRPAAPSPPRTSWPPAPWATCSASSSIATAG